MRKAASTTVIWCAAIAYPPVLAHAMEAGRHGFTLPVVLPPLLLTGAVAYVLRRRPLPALALLLVAWFDAAVLMPNGVVRSGEVLITDLAVCYIAATCSRRTSLTAAGLTLATQISAAGMMSNAPDMQRDLVLDLLAIIAVWTVGNNLRERRQHAAEMAVRATEQAVTAERLRIARELHDMVAHSIGIIAIQAGMGGRVIETQPGEARQALNAIEATSRETLAGLRRMLIALRRAETAPLVPTPGLDDLDRLVAATQDAGVQVEVTWGGRRRPLPPDIDLSAFRIIQEAVTNVVRHADTDRCRVSIDYQDADLAVEVVDDGTGRPAPGAGYGLVGMRERAGLLNGRLTAGPRPEGGFRVAARLPLPAGAA